MESQDTVRGQRDLGLPDYLKIAVPGFAISGLWGSLHTLILPMRLLDMVDEGQKNTYLGLMTLTGLVTAMLIQPLAGALSDHSNFRIGRRRPYILAGVLFVTLLLPLVGTVKSYISLFLTYCLIQLGSNTAQGPYQAFIPELVPSGKRGHASGIKSLLEILGGVAFLYPVARLLDLYGAERKSLWLFLALGLPGAILLIMGLAAFILVRERPPPENRARAGLFGSYLSFGSVGRHGLYLFMLSRLFFFLAFTTIQTFALYFLRDVAGVKSPAEAMTGFAAAAVSGMLLSVYPAGRISDRWGRRPVGVTAGVLGASGVLLVFFFQHVYRLAVLAAGVIGISFGSFLSATWAVATDLAPPGEEARYLGLTNLATTGGAALARLVGPVIDFVNRLKPDSGYSVMLLICFASFVIGSWLLGQGRQSIR